MNIPLLRGLVGVLMVFGPIPLTMLFAHKLIGKPYAVIWPALLAVGLSAWGYYLFVNRIERRPLHEFSSTGAGRELGMGLLLGAVLVLLTLAGLALTGHYTVDGMHPVGGYLFLPLAGQILVGVSEELVMRGVVFQVTERALGVWAALMVSSLLFALGHLFTPAASNWAFANMLAVGVLQGALYLYTGRLWLCIGAHIGWNVMLEQGFSAVVSGHEQRTGVLSGQVTGSPLWTGGAFGIEASVVTLVVSLLAAAVFLLLAHRRGYLRPAHRQPV
ncbi:CPBP family intramembrane glutamic endopeptidase [Chitinimonas sp. BJYL2]|uniref:CPBP family intramembrane glutamic endopeptidase n=1 Tax=Chitinimonas sp. BJYL2 TaxID=2976696 RepID=UPI0022B43E2E|nr:type II CAAX endopeptidase family protein [Chitinimonas sp. BJYL2]